MLARRNASGLSDRLRELGHISSRGGPGGQSQTADPPADPSWGTDRACQQRLGVSRAMTGLAGVGRSVPPPMPRFPSLQQRPHTLVVVETTDTGLPFTVPPMWDRELTADARPGLVHFGSVASTYQWMAWTATRRSRFQWRRGRVMSRVSANSVHRNALRPLGTIAGAGNRPRVPRARCTRRPS